MVCVRCGLKLGVGKLICERCGTAVSVDESAVKNVNVRKLETGDLIYFMPEKPLAEISQAAAPQSLEAVTLPVIKSETTPPYSPKAAENPSADTDTRKTVFKYMSESKSRLEEIRTPHDAVKPASPEPLKAKTETPAFTEAAGKQEEDDGGDFWDNIEDVESGLRAAAERINIGCDNSEEADSESPEPPTTTTAPKKGAIIDDGNDHAAAPLELLYRTEYKKSAEAMSDSPDTDYELKAPLGTKPVSKELISLFESPKERSMSAGEWLGTVVLLLIPGINLVSLIIWALGGCKKRQKTLFARAFLIIILILLAASVAVYFIFLRGMLRLDTGILYSVRDCVIGFFRRIYSMFRGIFK